MTVLFDVRIHTGNLRLLDPELAEALAAEASVLSDSWNLVVLDSLTARTRGRLVAALPLLSKIRNPNDEMGANKDFNDAQIAIGSRDAAKNLKAMENAREAKEQLAAYQAQGLLDCPENAEAIEKWVIANANSIFAKGSIYAAVENLRGQLRWKKAALAAPVVAPVTPTEPVLPRNATAAEAKAYLRKIRQQQQPNVPIYDDGFKIEL